MKKIDKIIVGTHNNGKFKEICDLLPANITKISPKDLNLSSPNEIGSTFKENSKIKAEYFAEKANLIAISDDSGLAIDLLSGAPGIYSSRWAGPTNDFSAAIEKVYNELKKIKFLLKEQGMTINGVKKLLNNDKSLKLDEFSNNPISVDNIKIKNKLKNISNLVKQIKKLK